MSDTSPVECPSCHQEVDIPVEEMVAQTYRMDGDGNITLTSPPPTLVAHLDGHLG